MLQDVDKTLETLLRRHLPDGVASQISISFASPDAEFPPASVSLPAVDLFLYDVRENRELRSNEWHIERREDRTAFRSAPAVRVDCSYLITAWSSESSSTPTHDEHLLLGEVMRVLLRFPTLPEDVLEGALAGGERYLPATALQPGHLQGMADFWQALGGKPRAALNYTVTIAVPIHAPEALGVVVEEREVRLRRLDD